MSKNSVKKFKDPVYGYIEIDEKMVVEILDTAVFQRLRNIIQTSYSPLYASALHNRFVHSIGVYHLGKILTKNFSDTLSEEITSILPDYGDYLKIFEMACLLHDVGHAPFSHTGEKYYLKDAKRDDLHKEIIALVKDDELNNEIINNSYKAAAHELMSVIVALKAFAQSISIDKRSFFARCITGYKYTEKMNEKKQVLNCLIELLNSSVIDVDKLDYLIRDSHMSGFSTVTIDYIRLLESICILKKDNIYSVCYDKSAVSVIENVVYAHDAERKWIQNHPVVLYEVYLLEKMLDQVFAEYMGCDYLDYEYLTEIGKDINSSGRIRLIDDGDVTFLMKNLESCDYVQEYYDRKQRRHPIWKTEAEYQAIFIGNEETADIIEQEFSDLMKYLNSIAIPGVVDSTALERCRADADEIKMTLEKKESLEPEQDKEVLIKRQYQIEIMESLEAFAKSQNFEIANFEFVIISANQFNSGFRKPEFSKINMTFPELKEPCAFSEVSNVLKASESKGEKFFYLYYKRKERSQEEKELNIKDLIGTWVNIAYRIKAHSKEREAAEKLK